MQTNRLTGHIDLNRPNGQCRIIVFELIFIVKDIGLISCPNLNFKYKIDILHN